MGLAVHDGKADENREQGVNTGYPKRRRTLMYVIEESLIKSNRGYFKQLYDDRKEYELERDENGYNSEFVRRNRNYFLNRVSGSNLTRVRNNKLPIHIIEKRSRRYMSKNLLKYIWNVWHETI